MPLFRNTSPKNSMYVTYSGVRIKKSDPLLQKLNRLPHGHSERNALEASLIHHIRRKKMAERKAKSKKQK